MADGGRGVVLVNDRRKRRWMVRRRLTAVVVAVVALGMVVGGAKAAEVRTDDRASVEAGERVADDVYLFGGSADVAGTVTGDVVVVAGDFDATGRIDGSLAVAAGEVVIDGRVGRSVRATGGEVTLSGAIGGDLLLLGGRLEIEPGASVAGDVLVLGGNVEVLGTVGGDVRGQAGSLRLNGRIDGDVRVDVDELTVGDQARLAGDLRYGSRDEGSIAPGATIGGATTRREPERFLPQDNVVSWLGSAIFRLLCALVAGLVIVLLMPRSAAAVADAVRATPLASLVIGGMLLVGLPIVLALTMITVIGIPIALVGLGVYAAALYLSQVFVGMALGRVVLPSSWDDGGRGYNLLAMTIGVIILAGLRLVPVPFLGFGVALLTAVFGLGALAVGLRRRGRAAGLAGTVTPGARARV